MTLFGWEQVDRNDSDYKTCLAGVSAVGTAAGVLVGAIGAAPTAGTSLAALPLAGTAVGFATGYLLCPYLAPAVRRKITLNGSLTQKEVESAADAMGRYAEVRSAAEAVRLLSIVRKVSLGTRNEVSVCQAPKSVARKLLSA